MTDSEYLEWYQEKYGVLSEKGKNDILEYRKKFEEMSDKEIIKLFEDYEMDCEFIHDEKALDD